MCEGLLASKNYNPDTKNKLIPNKKTHHNKTTTLFFTPNKINFSLKNSSKNPQRNHTTAPPDHRPIKPSTSRAYKFPQTPINFLSSNKKVYSLYSKQFSRRPLPNKLKIIPKIYFHGILSFHHKTT